jgi:hypothetical protein
MHMLTQLQTVKELQTATPAVARPELPSLDQALSVIAVDAAIAPEAYLRETEVPHGGE